MPLKWPLSPQAQMIDDSDLTVGIVFAMVNGGKRIECRITQQALLELASPGGKETSRDTFNRCRQDIGDHASALYDDGEDSPVITNSN
jgi:hypothetical protein